MITDTMKEAHHDGDRWLELAEAAINSGDRNAAQDQLAKFAASLLQHFGAEEEILFPALEQAMGQGFPPVQMMRLEHSRLREMLSELQAAMAQGDDDFFAAADALKVVLLQHNLKEEGVLYPLADRALAAQRASLLEALQAHA